MDTITGAWVQAPEGKFVVLGGGDEARVIFEPSDAFYGVLVTFEGHFVVGFTRVEIEDLHGFAVLAGKKLAAIRKFDLVRALDRDPMVLL